MGYWNSRGLRGSSFEEMINMTNKVYREENLAIIQKIPTPIKPVKINNVGQITLGYFEQKSTVDYMGVVQGIPICFDAKETNRTFLPMQNIHPHQIDFMEQFEKQGGIAFLLVNFAKYCEYFYYPFESLKEKWNIAQNGGKKSISYDSFDKKLLVKSKNKYYIHYLETLNIFLINNKY